MFKEHRISKIMYIVSVMVTATVVGLNSTSALSAALTTMLFSSLFAILFTLYWRKTV